METLRLDRDGPVWTLTLHRPERRNAMNSEMVRELSVVFDEIEVGVVRVLVLRGAEGHFVLGATSVTWRQPPLPNRWTAWIHRGVQPTFRGAHGAGRCAALCRRGAV